MTDSSVLNVSLKKLCNHFSQVVLHILLKRLFNNFSLLSWGSR